MDILNKTAMIEPVKPQPEFIDQLIQIFKVVAPWGSGGAVCWNAINKFFKYFSDSREAELEKLIEQKMQPELDRMIAKLDRQEERYTLLLDKFDRMQASINAINNKM